MHRFICRVFSLLSISVSHFQIMSAQAKYTQFLLQLADLGCTLQLPQLRDSARALLNIMPADQFTGRYIGILTMIDYYRSGACLHLS